MHGLSSPLNNGDEIDRRQVYKLKNTDLQYNRKCDEGIQLTAVSLEVGWRSMDICFPITYIIP